MRSIQFRTLENFNNAYIQIYEDLKSDLKWDLKYMDISDCLQTATPQPTLMPVCTGTVQH
jgi:hypothetical protein